VAGRSSTATHGTGATLRNISAQWSDRVGSPLGDVRELTSEDGDLLRARGFDRSVGAITAVTWHRSAFTSTGWDEPRPLEDVLTASRLTRPATIFEFFVFPHTSVNARVIERNRPTRPASPRSRLAAWINDVLVENVTVDALSRTGRASLSNPRLAGLAAASLALGRVGSELQDLLLRARCASRRWSTRPARARAAALRQVSRNDRRGAGSTFFFPIEFRVVAGDDALISPTHEQDSCYIAVHQYRGMDGATTSSGSRTSCAPSAVAALGQAPLPRRGVAGERATRGSRFPGDPRSVRSRPGLRQRSTPSGAGCLDAPGSRENAWPSAA